MAYTVKDEDLRFPSLMKPGRESGIFLGGQRYSGTFPQPTAKDLAMESALWDAAPAGEMPKYPRGAAEGSPTLSQALENSGGAIGPVMRNASGAYAFGSAPQELPSLAQLQAQRGISSGVMGGPAPRLVTAVEPTPARNGQWAPRFSTTVTTAEGDQTVPLTARERLIQNNPNAGTPMERKQLSERLAGFENRSIEAQRNRRLEAKATEKMDLAREATARAFGVQDKKSAAAEKGLQSKAEESKLAREAKVAEIDKIIKSKFDLKTMDTDAGSKAATVEYQRAYELEKAKGDMAAARGVAMELLKTSGDLLLAETPGSKLRAERMQADALKMLSGDSATSSTVAPVVPAAPIAGDRNGDGVVDPYEAAYNTVQSRLDDKETVWASPAEKLAAQNKAKELAARLTGKK